jgi:hypothetical protein
MVRQSKFKNAALQIKFACKYRDYELLVKKTLKLAEW